MWSEQPRIVPYVYALVPIGISFAVTGGVMFIPSVKELRGFEDRGVLVTRGIYSKIRHQMYFGWMLIVIGVPLATRSLYTLYTTPIGLIFLIYWKVSEERELEEKYGERYRK